MNHLDMELRGVDTDRREIIGVVAPYNETSYLAGIPGGERLTRGCFAKSIEQRATKIPLLVGHDHRSVPVGMSTGWEDTPDGLVATFHVRPHPRGDEVLTDAREGYLAAMSVGFEPLTRTRGPDGAVEVRSARLHEVSLVAVGAYAGAQVVAVRSPEEMAADFEVILRPFRNPPPRFDFTPFDRPWL